MDNFLDGLDEVATAEKEKDTVGGVNTLESGIYPSTITSAYFGLSTGGAKKIVLEAKSKTNQIIRSTLFITSGTAKGGKNYYEKDGKTHYLPGWLAAQSLVTLTLGIPINKLEPEEKVVGIYNYDLSAEVPTPVSMITQLIGKEINIGLIKQTVNKRVKDAQGKYVPSADTRDENEIDKFFHADTNMTTAEILANAPKAVFIETWKDKWDGVTRDKTVKVTPGKNAPNSTAKGGLPTESLFGDEY